MKNNTDELNYGYLSHNILYKIYTIIDFVGKKLIKRKPLVLINNNLLFINLGLIGDLIIFRYVINNFLKLDYSIDILIQEEYKFLFADLHQINILTVKQYKDKKIVSGFLKIFLALKRNNKKYAVSCHFRGYLGTGILSTFLSGVANNAIGYGTSGFGFLLNKQIIWQTNVHETVHIMDILQVLMPEYNSINLSVFDNLMSNKAVEKYLLADKPYIVFHATSQNDKKNIPKSVLRATIEFLLANSRHQIIFVGLANEVNYIANCFNKSERIIVTNGEIGMFEIMGLILHAKLFIGIDSSIAHLISSINTPKIILWHNLNSGIQWAPLGDNLHIIHKSMTEYSDNVIINKIASILHNE
jgi:ADP-heptose:LPS heptosyltransferase